MKKAENMTNSNRVEHASETWLTDATVFEVNRTPAHSNHKCFTHDPQKPYISCEYMHTMGNSVGNLDEYTALERYPHYQGGFIWDFIDQAIYATQPAGRYTRCVDNVIEQVDEDTLKAVYTYELATPRTRSVAGTYPANTNTPNVPPSAGFHVSVWPVARFRIEASRKPPCLAVTPSNSIW